MIIEWISPWVVSIMGIIVVLPFYSLAERKIMGYIQYRKGPNKVGLLGVLQPVSDGIKLMMKKNVFLWESKKIMFYLMPMFSFLTMLTMIMVSGKSKFYTYSILMVLSMLSVKSLSFLGMAWASKTKYSKLGAMRMISQVMSYELSLLGVLMMVFYEVGGASFKVLSNYPKDNVMLFVVVLLVLVFAIESHRVPFDFAEGESELVSGFNVEYASFLFALVSLSEYGGMVISAIMMGFFFNNWIFQLIMVGCMMFFFLWLRGTFPRYRYDLLMEWGWVYLLPMVFIFMWVVFL